MTFTYPYLITSDQHCHQWSAFSGTTPEGLNTRLDIILNEMKLAHQALKSRKGGLSIYAGDLFHVRGKIEPSVFNPTFDTIRSIHEADPKLESWALPGNHDLEGKDSNKLGNAMQQLENIPNFHVTTEVTLVHNSILIVPWEPDLTKFREWSDSLPYSPAMRAQIDMVIHAPVNAVIKGIPDHGLEARELAALGFRRVFVGHYHDHKVMEGGKVISIGASTHQTWSDSGTTAGFILVYEDHIEHIESAAPKFVDLHDHDIADETELAMVASGNYVRLKVDEATPTEIKQYREDLKAAGALDSVVIASNTRTKTVSRTGTTVSASVTLEASVAEYVEKQLKPHHREEVQKLCAEQIAQARAEA